MNANKSRIFISYSHRGNSPEWKATLLRALHVFEQHHLLDVWQDGKIRVSSYWHDDIQQAMSDARLAVVLLTREALESEYILNTEFPFLRERQQRDKLPVFPVVCEECDWKAHDWLRATQAPNESNPLSRLSAAAQDRVFRKLATDIAEELSRTALAELPKPDQPPAPDHIYLDKFPLTRGGGQPEKLIGREQELALLDLAFAQPHTVIASLVAWGGVGKTMLVQHWLQRLQRESWFGARRVYGWSFYSQGTREDRQASEDTFLAHALEWFGVQCEPTLSPWEKGRLLADAVARERTLLILDGIEPLQYPPGPMGGQLRAPGVQSLLKHLARKANDAKHPGLCLVTTREPLTDLTDFERRPDSAWGSVLRVDLGNLTEEAGASLLHHAGAKRAGAAEIKPDDAELFAASCEVDGHALTLHLLGRFLARAHGSDIRRRDLVKFEEADRKEQGGTTFKMLAAFENWFNRSGGFYQQSLAILRMLGLFDRPADAGCLAALRKPPFISGLTDPLFTTRLETGTGQVTLQPVPEEEWNTATSFLADFGLIAVQADSDNRGRLLDCHPLIREHFARQLQRVDPDTWRSAHRRLYEHLKVSTEDKVRPSIEELQPLYQAVAHGCKASLQQEACDTVYRDRIVRSDSHYTWHELGAYSAEVSAQSYFYDHPWRHVTASLSEGARAWMLGETGFCLRALGRLMDAIEPMVAGIELAEMIEHWVVAAQIAVNLSELELIVGDLHSSLRHAEQSAGFADHISDDWPKFEASRTTLASALHQIGRTGEALEIFAKVEAIQAMVEEYPILYSIQGFAYCDLLLAQPELAAWKAFLKSPAPAQAFMPMLTACKKVEERATQTLQISESNHWLLFAALDHLTLARAALYGWQILQRTKLGVRFGTLDHAREHTNISADVLRKSGRQDQLPRSLLTRAWLRFTEGDTDGARADLDEAWDIAERGPMRPHLADIHLYRARLFHDVKPYPWDKDKHAQRRGPKDDLAAARALIEQCGYWRRKEEIEDAESQQERKIMENTTDQKIKALFAEVAIHDMNGDDDKAIEALEKLERYCVQVGKNEAAARVRGEIESFRQKRR